MFSKKLCGTAQINIELSYASILRFFLLKKQNNLDLSLFYNYLL